MCVVLTAAVVVGLRVSRCCMSLAVVTWCLTVQCLKLKAFGPVALWGMCMCVSNAILLFG